MRLNGKRIVEAMEEKSLTEETVCSRTVACVHISRLHG